jgi:hypothetical protein
MMKTALLIDGAFLWKKFRAALKRDITAPDVQRIVEKQESLTNLRELGIIIFKMNAMPMKILVVRIVHVGGELWKRKSIFVNLMNQFLK